MVTSLIAVDGVVRLTCDAREWCTVVLDQRDSRYELGADVRGIIVARLCGALHSPTGGDVVGEIEGQPVRWVLSLSERHVTVFVGQDVGSPVFFFQAADGTLLARLQLTSSECDEWKRTLGCSPSNH